MYFNFISLKKNYDRRWMDGLQINYVISLNVGCELVNYVIKKLEQ